MNRRTLGEIATFSSGLQRPECVRFGSDGTLYASDGRGGVSMIDEAGCSHLFKAGLTAELTEPLLPNGIHPERDGSFLIAHLGQFEGGIFRLLRDGELQPYLRSVDGMDLPPTNYVTRDANGRMWATVSTKLRPRSLDYRKSADTGFIVMDDGRGPRVVADGLRYTNECAVSPDGRWLYVNETFAKRTIRMPILGNGGLGPSEIVIELQSGEFPDGLAFDATGNLWIVCIFANSVVKVSPEGVRTTIISEPDEAYVADLESAYESDELTATHMASSGASPLKNISSIAFRPDNKIAFLGSLQGDRLLTFDWT
ncbi:SMP-30/gluconolactonase/LRE family protein (plasmid) [Agrobacterium leguminum]|uniref:SMP-30/gluconolactonase/LRE family protein n=1 Tax=Agrobacterium leguminum TaxID=2792015 RepID=UPI00272CECD5|nr:SMP-30/gluconolactonase/LRE family protein [Agrobacterium leguminum]WLE00990.1 SMP-30/gluconolactonase/LRE family protein [Agrobacterium leguminum]